MRENQDFFSSSLVRDGSSVPLFPPKQGGMNVSIHLVNRSGEKTFFFFPVKNHVAIFCNVVTGGFWD